MRIVVLAAPLAFAAALLSSGRAAAHPPPPPPPPPQLAYEPIEWHHDRAMFEWSTWIRLGAGYEHETSYQLPRLASDGISNAGAEALAAPSPVRTVDQHWMLDAALGADVTFPIPTSHVRLGPWLELRPHGVFFGTQVNIAFGSLPWFWTDGEKAFIVRGGASSNDLTAAIAYGFRCPWKLDGPWNPSTRYMIGVRLVASYTRSRDDASDWNASFGLEFEPVGALRYIAGIRSWY